MKVETPKGLQNKYYFSETAANYALTRGRTAASVRVAYRIASEVLPSIRKTGGYEVSQGNPPSDFMKVARFVNALETFGARKTVGRAEGVARHHGIEAKDLNMRLRALGYQCYDGQRYMPTDKASAHCTLVPAYSKDHGAYTFLTWNTQAILEAMSVQVG